MENLLMIYISLTVYRTLAREINIEHPDIKVAKLEIFACTFTIYDGQFKKVFFFI